MLNLPNPIKTFANYTTAISSQTFLTPTTTQMIEILDTTDATLVGGKFEGFMKFAGALKFGEYHGRQEFAIFSGHCDRTLPQFGCEQCDSTSNIFMAKTHPVLDVRILSFNT